MVLGIWGSPWLDFKYFDMFFQNPVFWTLIKNTLGPACIPWSSDFPFRSCWPFF